MAWVANLLEGVVGGRPPARISAGEPGVNSASGAMLSTSANVPPGRSTLSTSRTNAPTSGKWCGAMREVTRSNCASGNGSACASAVAVSMLAKPLDVASLRASSSISAVMSLAITCATCGAKAAAVWPAPVAMSSARQCFSGRTRSTSRQGLRPSHARSRSRRPPRGHRTAAGRGIWSWIPPAPGGGSVHESGVRRHAAMSCSRSVTWPISRVMFPIGNF